MAVKGFSGQQRAVEEVFFQNESVSLCLLVNRRARTMRVIDFRAGPSNAKRMYVRSLARREGVDKVYTLVERDEVQTWVKLGFAKEASIPGFYKRSDAFLLGLTEPTPVRGTSEQGSEVPASEQLRSETRLVAAPPAGAVGQGLSPAQATMERTIATAKRWVKAWSDKPFYQAKVTPIDASEARRAVVVALRQGSALTAFEPFGRDVERSYLSASARTGFELLASTESQPCFGNAFLELLQSPKTEGDRLATIGALRAICDKLQVAGTVCCFSLAPSDDVGLAAAFLQNGFRRTGLLLDHLLVGRHRKDAILWSRKLTNPGDE